MPIDKNLTAWQILGVAIRSEVDAAAFYTRLQERVKNVLLVQKLKFLALEERHHRTVLEKLLAQRYPDEPADVPALFEAALEAEKAAEAYYNDAAARVEDEAGRRVLAYLGRVERSHQAMISSEIDLIRRFPDYYNVEDAHIAQDLFHVGP